MRLITKPVDNNYMHFFVNYFKTVQYASATNKHWSRQKVFERIDYVLGKYFDNFILTGETPDNFINAEYFNIENLWGY